LSAVPNKRYIDIRQRSFSNERQVSQIKTRDSNREGHDSVTEFNGS